MPPFVGVAVKVTGAPEQMVVVVEAIATKGITLEAVIVMALLVAVSGVAQGSLLVITTVTWSLLARAEEVNVAKVSPTTVTPFIRHT